MKEKVVTTRKDHTCAACGEVLPKGERAVYRTRKDPVYEGGDSEYGSQVGISYSNWYLCPKHIEPPRPRTIEGKSASRVHPVYKPGTEDWQAEYDMLLPDGITCTNCHHCNRCVSLFGQKETDTGCQWHPSRYSPIN